LGAPGALKLAPDLGAGLALGEEQSRLAAGAGRHQSGVVQQAAGRGQPGALDDPIPVA
jgi:hypothetical protein